MISDMIGNMPVRCSRDPISTPTPAPSRRGGSATKPLIALAVCVVIAVAAVMAWKSMWTSAGAQRVSPNQPATPTPADQSAKSVAPSRVPDEGKIEEVLSAAAARGQVGDWAGAEAILRSATQTYPGVKRVHQSLAECLLQAGKREAALEQYEKAIAAGDPDAELLTITGTVASAIGNAPRAMELYKQATVKSPDKGDAFVLLGLVQMKHATLDEAKASLLQAGRLISDRGVIWGTLAEIALRENKLQLAEQYIAKARTIEPNMLDWRLIEARLRNRQNQPQKSVEVLGGVSESELLQRRTAKLLSESLGMMGEKREAMDLLCRASEANQMDAELALDAAMACDRAGDSALAIKMVERASSSGDDKIKAAAAALLARLRPTSK